MDYNQAIEWLYSIGKFDVKLGLDRIEALLEKLDNPQKKLGCIHVAGTNGKGSVTATLNSILIEAGYKTAMYTSPHLVSFNERIRVNNEDISDADVVRLTQKLKEIRKDETFFEVITAMAFLYFFEKKIDIAVIEVGMGGRLDATNVIIPMISIITNIGLEHKEHLGNTLRKIAKEKAGIIKENIPLVTGAKGAALDEIVSIAKAKESNIYFSDKIEKLNSHFNIGNHKDLEKSLAGEFQLMNTALALKAIDILIERREICVSDEAIKNGLKNAKWPGRLQFIEKNVLLDCAHNPDGTRVLRNELLQMKPKKITLMIGILKDKDYRKMLGLLVPLADSVILTKPNIIRAAEPADLMKTIKKYCKKTYLSNDSKKALKIAKKIQGDSLLVIAGSIYLIGEVLEAYGVTKAL